MLEQTARWSVLGLELGASLELGVWHLELVDHASISSLLKRSGSDNVSAMFPADPGRDDSSATSRGFQTTHWTMVLAAREKDGTVAR